MPDTTPEPELTPEPDVLPKRKREFPRESESDPRIEEGPLTPDFGIPHIDLDKYGRFKVPKLKADYCLLEQAHTEFYMGLNLDEPKPIAWLWPGRIPIGKLTLIEGESNSGTSFLVADMAARVTRGSPWPGLAPPSQPSSSPPTSPQQPGPLQPGHAILLPTDHCQLTTDNCPPQGHVILVNGGDNMHDTLLPRLMKMGANLYDFTILSKITTHDPAEMRAGKADTNRRLNLPADLGHIEYQLSL